MLLMMKKVMFYCIFISLSVLCFGCNPGRAKLQQVSVRQTPPKPPEENPNLPLDEEQEFRIFFKRFSAVVASKKIKELAGMMHFPFYSGHFENETGMGTPSDPLSQVEFLDNGLKLFTRDIWKLLPLSKEDDLSEIDKETSEIYYQTLWRITDKGCRMYELYRQYPEQNTKAEAYFAFVFGKVDGKYKAIALYSKWPLK